MNLFGCKKHMESLNNKLHRNLSIFFWLNIIALITGFILSYFCEDVDLVSHLDESVIFERYAIIITLASIPLVLKMFHLYVSKAKTLSFDMYQKKYKYLYIARIAIFDVVALMNIMGYYFYKANNFLYLATVIILAIAFCYPSKDALDNSDVDDEI